jgi:hypothetical protein
LIYELLEDVDRGQLTAAVVADAGVPLDRTAIEAAFADTSGEGGAQGDRDAVGPSLEARNRHALLQAQPEMPNRAPSFTSEELATRLHSTTMNPSQLANDLQGRGKDFREASQLRPKLPCQLVSDRLG